MAKPFLERLLVPAEASWSMLDRRLEDVIPFKWHHHPELELTLTLNSRGQRFIGDHVGSYDGPDLVLVGPNQPHTWSSVAKLDPAKPHVALVFWFGQDWVERLTASSIELRGIQALLARAGTGLRFSSDMAQEIRPSFESLFHQAPAERLLGLLAILNRIAGDEAALPLSSAPVQRGGAHRNRERIDRVLTHIHVHYAAAPSLGELADIAALSLSGLHRLFLKHTRATVSDYLMRLRIGDACARLSNTDQPVHHIAASVGYGSFANFNRQFKRLKAMTPRQYRSRFKGAGLARDEASRAPRRPGQGDP